MKNWTQLSRVHARIAIGFSSLVVVLYLLIPRIRKQLTKEDRFLEEATAWIFLAGFIAGAVILARYRRSHFRLWYLFIPALCLLGFLDEISFGERSFDWDMPKVRGKTIDGAHDFVDVAYRLLTEFGGTMGFVVVGLFGAAFLVVLVWNRRKILAVSARFPPLKFGMIFVACLSVALPFDLEILPEERYFKFIEELMEMNSALALFFGSLAMAQGKGRGPPEIADAEVGSGGD